MKKIVLVLVCALALIALAACSTTMPLDAGATGTVGAKVGEASQSFIFGFPLKGEGGVQMAAKNGGIKKSERSICVSIGLQAPLFLSAP